jgi:hypothetical protein
MTDHRPITEQHWSKTLGPWPAKRPDSILLEHDERHPNHAFICDGATGRRILGLPKTLKATDTPKLPSQPITEQELAFLEADLNSSPTYRFTRYGCERLIAEVRHLRSANQQLNNILGTIKLEKIAKKVEADFNAPLDEELEIAEKLWETAIKGGSWENAGMLVPKLAAEIRRLRDFIEATSHSFDRTIILNLKTNGQWTASDYNGKRELERAFIITPTQAKCAMKCIGMDSEITGAQT